MSRPKRKELILIFNCGKEEKNKKRLNTVKIKKNTERKEKII